PRADLGRVPRVGDVEDSKAGAGRMARELRERNRGVDVGATANRLQPDLVRAAGIGANERELPGRAGVGDVVDAETPERVRPRAVLEADRGKLAGEACRGCVLDDRLFGPCPSDREVGAVGERRDVARPARPAQVVDPDALRGAVPSMPARQVGEAAVAEDVARVAAARIDGTEGANPGRA